ncbi:hypothetical protein J7J58_01910 [candidate division WOR-3 bacterium]|nr:hypothetical protein [candidate division WOR-3 bacterium]
MKKFLAIALVVLFVFSGCSLSNKEPQKPAEPKEVNIEMTGPSDAAIQTDTTGHAQTASLMVSSYSGLLNAYTTAFSGYTPENWDDGTYNSGQWQWSDSAGLWNIRWVATQDGDFYNWSVYVNGDYSNYVWNDFLLMSGRTSIDGYTGKWTIYDDSIIPPYDDNGSYPVMSWKWDIATDNSAASWWLYNGAVDDSLIMYIRYVTNMSGDEDLNIQVPNAYLQIHSEQNGSTGWIKYYDTNSPDQAHLVWYIYWDSTGHGGYEDWSNGTRVDFGTW